MGGGGARCCNEDAMPPPIPQTPHIREKKSPPVGVDLRRVPDATLRKSPSKKNRAKKSRPGATRRARARGRGRWRAARCLPPPSTPALVSPSAHQHEMFFRGFGDREPWDLPKSQHIELLAVNSEPLAVPESTRAYRSAFSCMPSTVDSRGFPISMGVERKARDSEGGGGCLW